LIAKDNHPPNEKPETKDVVFYVHGGAFVMCSPETYESFLCRFSRQLGSKVAFLAVAYRLAPENRYPASLQDVLDAYLWLQNSSSELTERVLGFKVGKVIVSGDSGGACMIASMLCSLADAAKRWPQKTFQLPDGFVSIVGLFTIKPESFPCSLMNTFDILTNPFQMTLLLFGAYSPFVPELEEYHSGKEIVASQSFQKLVQLGSHPYLSPLLYGDFQSLKEVPISLISTTACFLSDNSVLMAKKWPGKVQLVVLERVPHYFFMASGFGSCFKAFQRCAAEFQRLLSLP
jgi:acetyl esterase/lipase